MTQALVVEILSRLSLKDGVKNRMEPVEATTGSLRDLFEKAEKSLQEMDACDARVSAPRNGRMLAWRATAGQIFAGWSGHQAQATATLPIGDLARYVDLLEDLQKAAKERTSKQRALNLVAFAQASVETKGEVRLTTPKDLPAESKVELTPLPGDDPQPVKAAKPPKPKKEKPPSPAKALNEVLGSNPFEQALDGMPVDPPAVLSESAKKRKGKEVADASAAPARPRQDVDPDGEGKTRRRTKRG